MQKLLVSKFMLKRRVGRLEYEGIHFVCFECGMYDHRRESCPHEIREPTEPTEGALIDENQNMHVNVDQ